MRGLKTNYEILFNSSRDSLYSYDLSGRFTSANKTLCELLGLKETEILGRTHEELGFPEHLCREWDDLHKRVFESRNIVISETSAPLPLSDGELREFEVILNPVMDDSGCMIGIMGSTRDITEKKRLENSLREQAEQLKVISENTTDSIWVMDPNFKFTYLSPSTERLFGYTIDEWKNLEWDVFVHPEDLGLIRETFALLFQNPDVSSVSKYVRIFRKDKTMMWVEFTANSIRANNNNITCLVGITRDITERKKSEQKLVELYEEAKQINRLMSGREDRILELKREVNRLSLQLNQGIVYKSVEGDL